MSKKIYCDKCGEEIKKHDDHNVRWPWPNSDIIVDSGSVVFPPVTIRIKGDEWDLCGPCADKILPKIAKLL